MATREQLIEDFADHKYATGEKFARLINSMKLVQEPVESPAESGTSNSFIDSISQGADGKITATKKSVVLNYAQIQDKPTINGVTLMGDKTPAQLGLATANQVEVVSNKVDKLPSGYYYGKFSSVEDLPEATEKGYAYIASSDPTVFYTYLVSGAGAEWVDSGNKMVNTIDITTPKTAETELSKGEKYYASANVNDRPADVVAETGVVKSLGYRVLNPAMSFAEQVEGVNNANMIFEIKDEFDLGTPTEVTLSDTINLNGTVMYISNEITVSANQILSIESGIILNSDKDCILSYKLVSPDSTTSYYIASTNATIKYVLGSVVSLPNRVTLKFNGGKLKNCTLVCNNTSIETSSNGVFDKVRLNGSLRHYSVAIEYWVVRDGAGYDNSPNIKLALQYSRAYKRVTFSGTYYVSEPVRIFDRIVEGLTFYNDMKGGITANNGFKGVQVKSGTNIIDINAVLFHSSQSISELKNITIDANKAAKYGIYNIPIATVSMVNLNNLLIQNALVAGILQYSVEKVIWEKVFVRYCRVGVVITQNLFNENNYFDFGAFIGSPNMIVLKDCRLVECNYGGIFRGIWNLSLENLETAYNSLYGIYISFCGAVLINDYYTEGDAIANVWIDKQGNRTYASRIPEGETEPVENRNRVHQSILDAGIDGVNIPGNGLSDEAMFRTVIYIGNSSVVFNAPSFSGHPRADKMQITSSSDIKLPTEREYAGIDGYIYIAGNTNFVLNNYSLFDNTGNNWTADMFARIILHPLRLSMSISIIGKKLDKVKIFGNIMLTNYSLNHYINTSYPQKDYNTDRVLTYSSTSKMFSGLGAEEIYEGFPLYSMSTLGNTGYRVSKSIIDNLFGTAMNQYVATILIKLTETLTNQVPGTVTIAAYSEGYKSRTISGSADYTIISLKDAGYYFVQIPFWNRYPNDIIEHKAIGSTTATVSDVTYYVSRVIYIYSETEIQLNTPNAVLLNSAKNSVLSTDGYYKNAKAVGDTAVYIGHPVSGTTVEYTITYKQNFDSIGLYFNSLLTNQSSKLMLSPLYFYDVQESNIKVPSLIPLDKGQTNTRPSLTNNQIGFKYFDTEIGKPIFWNGTTWVDANGETVGLQVSDTSVLIGAAANSTKTVSVYYAGNTAPTITVLNSDDTANTWLTAAYTLYAPTFVANTYYSAANTKIAKKPSNWETNYMNYFTDAEATIPVAGVPKNEVVLTAGLNNTSAPRGAKALVTLGDGDELVIINVVQSY